MPRPQKTAHSSGTLEMFSFAGTFLGASARPAAIVRAPRWSVFVDGGRYSLTGKFLPGKSLGKQDGS